MRKKSITILFFVILFSINVFAFVTFPKASLSVDKNEINAGDSICATVEILLPTFAQLLKNDEDIVIDGWEIQDFSFVKDIKEDDKYILNLKITTFDSKIKEIPRVRLSYVNKLDLEKNDFLCEKFYFFSNSIRVNVISNLNDNFNIFDLKNIKKIKIPIMFYVLCLLFLLFTVCIIFTNILLGKIKKNIKVEFSAREIALRKLNKIIDFNNFDDRQINKYYCLISDVFRKYILSILNENNREITTTELLSLVSNKELLRKYFDDISNLFKYYDNAKYSIKFVNKENFIKIYNKTKIIINNIDIDYNYLNKESNV